jgi:hypothetical protein
MLVEGKPIYEGKSTTIITNPFGKQIPSMYPYKLGQAYLNYE